MEGRQNRLFSIPLKRILALAFFLRLALPLSAWLVTGDPSVFYSPDTQSYIKPAEGLLAGRGFHNGEIYEINRTPGYPLLLIPGLLTGHLEATTLLLQAALGCLAVYLVWSIAVLMFRDARIAGICALLYAVEPLTLVYTSALLTETLFTAVVLLFVLFLLRYLKEPALLPLILSAALLASSVYVRPVGYYLAPLIALLILAVGWKVSPGKRRAAAHALLFFVISMGLIVAWQVRNQRVAGYSGFSSVTDLSLYFYFRAAVQDAVKNDSRTLIPDMGKQLAEEEWLANFGREGEAKMVSDLTRMRKESLALIRDHPQALFKVYLAGMKRALTDPWTIDYFKLFQFSYPPRKDGDPGWYRRLVNFVEDRPLLFWGNLLSYAWLMTYILFGGFGLVFRRAPLLFWVAVTPAAYFLLISSGPAATQRFRVPAMPALCLAAGWGMWVARQAWRGRRGVGGAV